MNIAFAFKANFWIEGEAKVENLILFVNIHLAINIFVMSPHLEYCLIKMLE